MWPAVVWQNFATTLLRQVNLKDLAACVTRPTGAECVCPSPLAPGKSQEPSLHRDERSQGDEDARLPWGAQEDMGDNCLHSRHGIAAFATS